MERMAILFVLLIAAVMLLSGGILYAQELDARIRRLGKRLPIHGENVVVWDAVGLAGFTFGLLVLYLLLRG